MQYSGTRLSRRDPSVIIREAHQLHGAALPTSSTTDQQSFGELIRHAHALVSPDFYVIEHLKKSGIEPNYFDLFKNAFDEKIAATIFLTRQKLLDIEHSAQEALEIADARNDLSTFVEVLFRLKAVEALGIFFDFAEEQQESRVPWLWQNVRTRSLYLMALLPDCRDKVIRFLLKRETAVTRLQELVTTTKPETAPVFKKLLADFDAWVQQHAPKPKASQQPGAGMTAGMPGGTAIPAMLAAGLPPEEPAAYVQIYQKYENAVPAGQAYGIASLLSAEDRIMQALEAGDLDGLMKWIAEGSPAAMRSAFNRAKHYLAPDQYITLLENTLTRPGIDPVRSAATLLELGNVNRTTHLKGGTPRINNRLISLAMTTDDDDLAPAFMAIDELRSVGAAVELTTLIEKAPLQEVAEEGIKALRDLRRLTTMESILVNRPALRPAYEKAHESIMELHSIMDAAISCPSRDLTCMYVDRLRDMGALPEMEQLAKSGSYAGEYALSLLEKMRNQEIGLD